MVFSPTTPGYIFKAFLFPTIMQFDLCLGVHFRRALATPFGALLIYVVQRATSDVEYVRKRRRVRFQHRASPVTGRVKTKGVLPPPCVDGGYPSTNCLIRRSLIAPFKFSPAVNILPHAPVALGADPNVHNRMYPVLRHVECLSRPKYHLVRRGLLEVRMRRRNVGIRPVGRGVSSWQWEKTTAVQIYHVKA